MIKELINFTKSLDEDLKNSIYKPSKGVHITLDTDESSIVFIDDYFYYNGTDNLQTFVTNQLLCYNDDTFQKEVIESGIKFKQQTEDENYFQNQYHQALNFEKYSSYISMNQQGKFDKLKKIHSASPFSFAFNFSLGNSKNNIETELKNRILKEKLDIDLDTLIKQFKIDEVKKSINNYFVNAKDLCLSGFDVNEIEKFQLDKLEIFCSTTLFDILPKLISGKNTSKNKDVIKIESFNILKELKEKDYVRVYFKQIPIESWKKAYKTYYETEYPPNELKDSDFITTYNSKKPFNEHKTASFNTNFKINGSDAKILKEFKNILRAKPRIIPNPLPVFIFKEELQQKIIGIFRENEKLSFKEIVEKLWDIHKEDFNNYYLINWVLSKDIVFNDFDFVSKFEFEFDALIENLFDQWDNEKKMKKNDMKINNVFDLEQYVFKRLIGNKFKNIDYFKDLDIKDYKNRDKAPNLHFDFSFTVYSKYRKAVYDFVYKSKRQSIDLNIFKEMVFYAVRDDFTQNNGNAAREKLNIWFSLYEKFSSNNQNNILTMASKLKNYQDFVAQLAVEKADLHAATDLHFAFAAGQVIEYLIKKSKTDNKSYQLLEPYLQQSKCSEFKKAIANDIARYKHAINDNETRFKSVCAFVQTWETEQNMKDLLPEILAGIFSKNQFFNN